MDKIYLVTYYDFKYLLYANNKKEAINKVYDTYYRDDDVRKKDLDADRVLVDKDIIECI